MATKISDWFWHLKIPYVTDHHFGAPNSCKMSNWTNIFASKVFEIHVFKKDFWSLKVPCERDWSPNLYSDEKVSWFCTIFVLPFTIICEKWKKKISWKVFEKSPVKNNCSMFKITASIRNNMKTMSYVGNGRL